ncbi:hypothetical protein KY315_01870, partial [Candidatus Woesearchaeota archaeon]|nr:hypothetical protein [Candidatus Woesearchaeota archaeon]
EVNPVGAKTKIFEEPLMAGLDFEESLAEGLDIYEEDGVETLMEEEGISIAECGFMTGFLAS